ncbi:MAG: response regulator transcription factor [Chloroflexi bacterium]|nr:response regulator transcription factor [Chloroflexota bacterium]
MMRIVLADDHTVLRQALARVLGARPDIEVVGEAATGSQAVRLAQELTPDVVLMDISMPEMDGLAATARIQSLGLPVKVLVLTVHDREEYLFQALQAGALGYVLKETDMEELIVALNTVARGLVYIQPAMVAKLVADYLERANAKETASEPVDALTPREREILNLVASGNTTAQIADYLVVSPNTVRTHRDHIMAKLGLHGKAALIRYAVSRRLIESIE